MREAMVQALLTMDEVAQRLGGARGPVALSTLYGILKRIEIDNPGITFSRKVGRARMFTERDYQFIVEQPAWRAPATAAKEDTAKDDDDPVSRSVDRAIQSLRRQRTKRRLAQLRRDLKRPQ